MNAIKAILSQKLRDMDYLLVQLEFDASYMTLVTHDQLTSSQQCCKSGLCNTTGWYAVW